MKQGFIAVIAIVGFIQSFEGYGQELENCSNVDHAKIELKGAASPVWDEKIPEPDTFSGIIKDACGPQTQLALCIMRVQCKSATKKPLEAIVACRRTGSTCPTAQRCADQSSEFLQVRVSPLRLPTTNTKSGTSSKGD